MPTPYPGDADTELLGASSMYAREYPGYGIITWPDGFTASVCHSTVGNTWSVGYDGSIEAAERLTASMTSCGSVNGSDR